MQNEKVYRMNFSKIYPLLVAKAEKKGRTRAEVDEVISWLTGYRPEELEELRTAEISCEEFFRNAPHPLMREIRYLDKLVDELARGKTMEKILRKQPEK